MRRRDFVKLLGGTTAVWPLAARAQQPERVRRIGVLMGFPESDPEGQSFVAAFREGLQKLGWADGRNIRIDYRWAAASDVESVQRFAKELVALQPDLILSNNTPAAATDAHHPHHSRLSMTAVPSLKLAACCPTEMTGSIIFGARRPMPIASSTARSRASFPSRLQSSLSW